MSNRNNSSFPVYVISGPFIQSWNEKEFFLLIPSFVLVLIVMVIGIPGNIVTICVYAKKMRHTASRIFILALAMCDLANCFLTMPVEISIIVRFWTYDYPVVCAVGHTLTYILNGLSALLLCGIAVDRYRKICRPLKPVFTLKTVKLICLASMALAIAFYIPGFILYGTRTVEQRYEQSHVILVGKTCQIADKYKGMKLSIYIYGVWFLGTLSVMVVLIVLYSLIGAAVYKRLKLEEKRRSSMVSASKPKVRLRRLNLAVEASFDTSCSQNDGNDVIERQTQRPRDKTHDQQPKVLKTLSTPVKTRPNLNKALKERFRQSSPLPSLYHVKKGSKVRASRRIRAGRTTVMLFSVTIAYVLSFLPFMTIVVLRSVYPAIIQNLTDIEESVWNFFLRSYVINCAVNPILYGLFNKDFRKKMGELLLGC